MYIVRHHQRHTFPMRSGVVDCCREITNFPFWRTQSTFIWIEEKTEFQNVAINLAARAKACILSPLIRSTMSTSRPGHPGPVFPQFFFSVLRKVPTCDETAHEMAAIFHISHSIVSQRMGKKGFAQCFFRHCRSASSTLQHRANRMHDGLAAKKIKNKRDTHIPNWMTEGIFSAAAVFTVR